jgi:hypothetical protein
LGSSTVSTRLDPLTQYASACFLSPQSKPIKAAYSPIGKALTGAGAEQRAAELGGTELGGTEPEEAGGGEARRALGRLADFEEVELLAGLDGWGCMAFSWWFFLEVRTRLQIV